MGWDRYDTAKALEAANETTDATEIRLDFLMTQRIRPGLDSLVA